MEKGLPWHQITYLMYYKSEISSSGDTSLSLVSDGLSPFQYVRFFLSIRFDRVHCPSLFFTVRGIII